MLKLISLILILALLINGCSTSRLILSEKETDVFKHKLSRNDICKQIDVTCKNGKSIYGILLSFDDEKLKIFDKISTTKKYILYSDIRKIQVKEYKYKFLALTIFVTLFWGAIKTLEAINDMFQ